MKSLIVKPRDNLWSSGKAAIVSVSRCLATNCSLGSKRSSYWLSAKGTAWSRLGRCSAARGVVVEKLPAAAQIAASDNDDWLLQYDVMQRQQQRNSEDNCSSCVVNVGENVVVANGVFGDVVDIAAEVAISPCVLVWCSA